MIGVIFSFGEDTIEVRVIDKQVLFRTSQVHQFADIGGIRLDKAGTIKEFPDLKDNEDWNKIAKERFKEKINKMKTEKERVQYLIDDLTKFGYKPEYLQKQGFRPIKLK
jgi:hypothetical protein